MQETCLRCRCTSLNTQANVFFQLCIFLRSLYLEIFRRSNVVAFSFVLKRVDPKSFGRGTKETRRGTSEARRGTREEEAAAATAANPQTVGSRKRQRRCQQRRSQGGTATTTCSCSIKEEFC